MRISELSRAAGVPVATVKYYLREGLLHEGRRTSATQAQYDETHVARLRLVRALTGVGDLSVVTTREVLNQLDDPPESTHSLLGAAQSVLDGSNEATDVDLGPAEALVAEMGWNDEMSCPPPVRLAEAMAAMDAADFTLPEGRLRDYAQTMQGVAEREVDDVPIDSEEAAIRHVVLGTILVEPVLLALRRLAQIHASARRFGTNAASASAPDGRQRPTQA